MNLNNSKNYFLSIDKLFSKPGNFLAQVMEQKKWGEAFLVNSILIFIAAYIAVPEALSQAAERSIANVQPNPLVNISISLVSMISFFLMISIVAFLLYVFFGVGGSKGQYVNFFSLTMNGALIGSSIPALLYLLLHPFNLDIVDKLNLYSFFNNIPDSSLSACFLLQFEVFAIWFMIIITLGVAKYAGLSMKRCVFIIIGYFILRTTLLGFLSYFSANLMQKFGEF